MTTVIESTVAAGFCSGCGVCAGICPKHSLKMQWNEYGELNPVNSTNCNDCSLCVRVCPFADGNDNEDVIGKKIFGHIENIKHRSETGYYLSSGVGAVADERKRMSSASGGLASWYLVELLKRDVVDEVICVGKSFGDRLFTFFPAKTEADVYSATGSVYYPVEISEMLSYIKEREGRYAVIGLPCVLKGIRLAQEKSSLLRERIVMLVGLACSNLKSAHFTEYAAHCSGLTESIRQCSFRYKSYNLPRNFFKLRFSGEDGAKTEIDWGGKSQLWTMYLGRCLTLHSCDCCDDMHAELGDVTFMDAWLPEYGNEPRGTSLWVARTPLAEQILNDGVSSGNLDAGPISIEKVIQAQDSIFWKRDLLRYRLTLMQDAGEQWPKKRVEPSDGKELSVLNRDKVRKSLEIQHDSRLRYADGFEEFGRWFDAAWKDRPFIVRVITFSRSAPVLLYTRFKKYAIVRGMANIAKRTILR